MQHVRALPDVSEHPLLGRDQADMLRNTRQDVKQIDFDDSFIYNQLNVGYNQRAIPCEHFMRDRALHAFRMWVQKTDKTPC